nr:EF-hand calcium-binding domain-containing protein 4B isoform X2 [Hydra vulgaris]
MDSLIKGLGDSHSPKGLLATSQTEDVLYEKILQLFYLCDTDNKGYATRDNLYQLQDELGLNIDEIDYAFDQLDTDKDNHLTLEEFTAGFGLFLGLEHSICSKTVFPNEDFAFQVFTLIDKHDNGYITKNDLYESADVLEIETSQIDSLFHKLSYGKSERVYFENFTKNMFVIVSLSPPLKEIKRKEQVKARNIRKKNLVARICHMDLSSFTDEDVEKILLDQATNIFHRCDIDKKNYVTLHDLHSLSIDFALPEEVINEAFSHLDTKKVGFLTLDEFIYGFGCFLGIEDVATDYTANECTIDEESNFKAQELFQMCDQNNKGYVTKYDLNALTSELGLTDKQISDIFMQLDQDGNGFITLSEFKQGFISIVDKSISKSAILDMDVDNSNISSNKVKYLKVENNHEIEMKNEKFFTERQKSVQYESEVNGIDEMLCCLEEQVGSSISKDQLLRLWNSVSSSGDMMLTKMFETFLLKVHNEIKSAKKEAKYLEDVLEKKSAYHSEEISRICDEMEAQLQLERSKLMQKETMKELQIREDLQQELVEKEKHIEKCMQRQIALEKRLQEVKDKEQYLKQQNIELLKENNELEDKLNNSITSFEVLKSNLLHLEEQTSLEKKETLRAALRATQGMSYEHEDLIRRLDALRKMNQKLRDDRDAIEATLKTNVALPELSPILEQKSHMEKKKFSRMTSSPSHKPLTKQGSVMSAYFDSKSDICNPDNEQSLDFSSRTFSSSNEKLNFGKPDLIETEETDFECEDISKAHLDQPPIFSTPKSPRLPPVGSNSEDDPEISLTMLKHPPENPNRVYKIVFVGDSGVGKSSFIYRFCHNDFRPNFSATIGVDFQVKTLEICNNWIALQLWDTAGQERFQSLTKQYFRRADGIIIMFDLTSETSFTNVKGWMLSVEEGAEPDCVIALIGSKSDMVVGENNNQRKVNKEAAEKIAKDYNALYFEVSARSGENVNETIVVLAKKK